MKPKYKPQQTFSVAKDGFFGEFYPAAGEKFKGKSLVIFGGSAGLFLLTQVLAGMFVDAGMSTMAIAYHGEEGLPKALKDQPVDVVEKAAMWLKNNGYEKVGVWGKREYEAVEFTGQKSVIVPEGVSIIGTQLK